MTIVRHARDLDDLPEDPRVNGLLCRDEVRFDIPDVSRHQQMRFQTWLNRYQARCGCVAATVCFLMALGAGIAWLLELESFLSWQFVQALSLVLLGVCLATGAGKLSAMAVTRLQFRHACRTIRRELKEA
jgi:hypothetical protein